MLSQTLLLSTDPSEDAACGSEVHNLEWAAHQQRDTA